MKYEASSAPSGEEDVPRRQPATSGAGTLHAPVEDDGLEAMTRPLRIGSIEVPNRVFLAPLAGVSDVPFRRICREMGAGLAFVEMLNATTLIHGQRRISKILSRHAEENLLGAQVTGSVPERVGRAVQLLDKEGFDLIDLNMGCPVRKIVARGSGSALLRDPERLRATVREARAATDRPLSVKVRLGFTRKEINVAETARLVASGRAEMFTVHGRTRSERYERPVDHEGIRTGLDAARRIAPSLVTVGNGDVLTRDAARTMLERTGCDALMVSRGALGNPWIFRHILDPRSEEPTIVEWLDVIERFLDYHQAFHGDDKYSVVLTRKHLLWYASGFPEIRRFRARLSVVETLDEARQLLRAYVRRFPPDLRRYAPYDVTSGAPA